MPVFSENHFSSLLERASKYFQVFDGKDFWIPASGSDLHNLLEVYLRLDIAGRDYACESYDWGEEEFNEYWTFYPCGRLYDYCSDLEDSLDAMTESEYLEAIQKFANESPYDPWNNLD